MRLLEKETVHPPSTLTQSRFTTPFRPLLYHQPRHDNLSVVHLYMYVLFCASPASMYVSVKRLNAIVMNAQ